MKLLNKSIRLYLLYAALLLLISIPVLYFAIQRIVLEDVDEQLTAQKQKLISTLEKSNPDFSFPVETDISIVPVESSVLSKDAFYTITVSDSVTKENVPYRILKSGFLLNGKAYSMQLKDSLLDSEDLIESIVLIVGILILLIVSGLLVINQFLSKKLWKPFYTTLHKLKEFKIESGRNLQFETTTTDEFTDLNKTLTQLTNRNLEAFQSQKEFTENASHEMQTPLAVLQSKIDLLMQTALLTKEQSELIGDLADVSQRMNRLNKSLLLLTKIENNQFPETENIQLKQVVEKLIEQFNFQAEQKNITIENKFTDEIVITANRTLIEIMLGNLISNALKHNSKNGTVSITGQQNFLCFQNSGVTKALNADKIFERFQKQSSDTNSTGLGLQIARKIAEHYHFTIEYSFENRQHCFNIFFTE